MIRVRDYNNYFEQMCCWIQGLNGFVLVSGEAQFGEYIRQKSTSDFPLLIALIPSADSIAHDPDNILETATCLIYVMKKVESSDQTADSFLDTMEETQQIMQAIKEKMRADRGRHEIFSHLLERIDLSRMHTDPEYNYLGCNGWSLSFLISTPGY